MQKTRAQWNTRVGRSHTLIFFSMQHFQLAPARLSDNPNRFRYAEHVFKTKLYRLTGPIHLFMEKI